MPPGFRTKQTTVAAACLLLGAAALVAAALDLSADGLAHHLTSDFLTPFFFCADLLTGRHPLSGWTLSASPYFVPDHLALTALLAAFGQHGLAYALYTPAYYAALCLGAAGCAHAVTGRMGPALAAGLGFGNALLALRVLPGQALCLWWIGAPTCHGGVLLLGFAYLALLGAALRRGGGAGGPLAAALFGVGLAGTLSDSLFLFQVLLPASAALFGLRRRWPSCAELLRWQGGSALAAVAVAQAFKPLCLANDWFYFSRILRVAPTPANQWRALRQFAADVPGLLRDNPGFALLALAAAAVLWHAWRTRRTPPRDGIAAVPLDFYRVCCVASLAIMLPLPVLTCGWKNAYNVRYLFNWLVLPGFLLTLEAAARWVAGAARGRVPDWRLAGVGVAVFAAGLGWSAARLRHETLQFPYPDDVRALDVLLQRRGLRYGLAQYWDAKEVSALSHAGAELRQIRGDGTPFFWDNNAFAYYEPQADGTLAWPAYQYLLTDRLDEPALVQAFGEPQATETAGRYRVWIYGEEGQRRIREALEPAVWARLGARTAKAAFQR